MPFRSRFLRSSAAALALAAALASAPAVPAAAPPRQAPAGSAEAKPVDLNTADTATLESVPGLGKSLSQRIVAFREKNGPFQTVDDLLKVQGVGEKSIQKLRPYLTVSKVK